MDIVSDLPKGGNDHSNLPPITPEGNTLRKVIVQLLCLNWGGEYVDNPCQEAIGIILDVVPDGRVGKQCFEVDFGDDLSIQVVPIEDC
jgi:hypothetical protein